MNTFSSPEFKLQNDKQTIMEKLSDLNNLKGIIDKANTDKLQVVKADKESMTVKAPVIGEVSVHLTEKTDSMLRYEAKNTPIPLVIIFHLEERDSVCYGKLDFESQIPPFLSGMVSKKVGPALERIGEAASSINFKDLLK